LVSFKISEELKEALLKSKGRSVAVLLTFKDGVWTYEPEAYIIEKRKKDKVILKKMGIVEEPSELKKRIVKDIIAKIKNRIKEDVETAVEQALLEKTEAQLLTIRKEAETARLKRTRGCFWLVTENEEVLL